MSDTPETDALMDVWRVGKLLSVSVMLEHARKLERERDEARQDTLSLLKLIASIRSAVGDSTGKLMQDELVEYCQKIYTLSQNREL